jgi:rubrerythrin
MLLPLYKEYAIHLPVEPDPNQVAVPETLQNTCELGVESELENIALYDQLITTTDLPDVIDVLRRLQAASRDHHLPANAPTSTRRVL